ncbi:hypothetical protein F511_31139 [Dorcoceras hygrometricum]|uniref:Uncharacterized protein n=1 Tax=Dorcoceras hygrometricum TaxID=472368 RepID=A0A2Z7CCW4_9LAMI|nr:hypothetical protein F511_31139 [Dorcoceras hygrometricum]
MASSLFVNAFQVEFEYVLAMDNTEMSRMFKSLVDTELEGFLAASGSVYEVAVVEFFANARVIAGNIVSFVANMKLAMRKDILSEAFGLPTEGPKSFLDVLKDIVLEMRNRFSRSDVPIRAPSKKREMKMEFR